MLFGVVILAAGVAGIDWWAVATEQPAVERWAKPLTMIALIALTVVLDPPEDVLVWLLAGAILGMIGDIALLSDGEAAFMAGLSAFAIGHLCYGIGALHVDRWWQGALAGAAVLVPLLSFRFATRVVSGAQRAGGAALAGAVVFYAVVISFMVITAGASGSTVALVGAVLFAVSDWVLGNGRFAEPIPGGRLMVMVPYHLGQALLLVGLTNA